MTLEMRIAKHIKSIRLDLGWSQERLAKRAGISSRTLSRIELGTVTTDINSLYCIAVALRVSLEDLVVPLKEKKRVTPDIHPKALIEILDCILPLGSISQDRIKAIKDVLMK